MNQQVQDKTSQIKIWDSLSEVSSVDNLELAKSIIANQGLIIFKQVIPIELVEKIKIGRAHV